MHSSVGDTLVTSSGTNGTANAGESLEEILDDPHCRHLLEYLRSEDGPVAESTLARHVVAQITSTPPEDVTDEVQRRVQTWLHHGQLPALDEHGVVEFDADAAEIRLGRHDSTA